MKKIGYHVFVLVLFIAGTTALFSQSKVSKPVRPYLAKDGRPLTAREIFKNIAGNTAPSPTAEKRLQQSGTKKTGAIDTPKKIMSASLAAQPQWVARYNGPGNGTDALENGNEQMAIHNGNVYVTGYSYDGTNFDYATIKYDSSGNQKWVERYNNGEGGSADAYAIAVDANGNVYVTGSAYGGTGEDYVNTTIKYDSAGNQVWISYFDTAGSINLPSALSVDASGNVYVAGYAVDSSGNADFFTLKYASSGSKEWARLYNSNDGGQAYAYALAVDANSNVYVTGSDWSADANYINVTIKYDSSGNQLWLSSYNGLGLNNACSALAVDATGNVYAAGYASTDGSDQDYVTIKYNGAGNQQWAKRYNSGNAGGNYVEALAVDGSGSVYVTGFANGGPANGSQYATIKYDSSGNQKWASTYNGPADGTDQAEAIALDTARNVYVTGYSANLSSTFDYATIRYDTSGNQVWAVRFDSSADAVAHDIKIDSAGNVYVAGTSSNGANADYVTIKYKQVQLPDTITASAGANGNISPSGNVPAGYGLNTVFICTPDTGYHIDSIFVDSAYAGNTSPDTIKNVTTNHTISVTFVIDTLTITASAGANGGIAPTGVTHVTYGGNQSFTITPNAEYLVDSIFVDGVGYSGATTYTFTDVTANHTLSASFRLAPPYLVSYRTFTSNAIATSTFGKKTAVPVKKKTDKYQFSTALATTTAGTGGLHIEFGSAVDTSYAFTCTGSTTKTNDSKLKIWDFTFPTVGANDIITVAGFSLKKQKVSKYWWTNGGGTLVGAEVKKDIAIGNTARLPMPNAVNAVQQAFADAAFPGGLLIGKNHSTDGLKKKYGWVLAAKYTDVMASLYAKGLTQNATSHAFDVNMKGKALAGKYKSLSPKTYNSQVFGDLLTLKINIAASNLGFTPPHLGDLEFVDTVANEFNGLTIDSLAVIGDSLMEGTYSGTSHNFDNIDLLRLDTVVSYINNAFNGAIDTVSFGDSLVFTGARELVSAALLHPAGSAAPISKGLAIQSLQKPAAYKLYQNYPNPFNPTTTIQFDLPEQSTVTLRIYNILGQEVTTLFNHATLNAGTQVTRFNAANYASGVYLYRIVAASLVSAGKEYTKVEKMMLIK